SSPCRTTGFLLTENLVLLSTSIRDPLNPTSSSVRLKSAASQTVIRFLEAVVQSSEDGVRGSLSSGKTVIKQGSFASTVCFSNSISLSAITLLPSILILVA